MNKIKLSILALSTFLCYNLDAQIMIAPKLGLNLAYLSDVKTTNGEVKVPNLGINLGGVLSLSFTKMLSLQPELLYSVKGFKFNTVDNYAKMNANYLEIPVLAKYTFKGKKIKGFVNLGPYFSYLMSGKEIEDTSEVKTSESISFNEITGTNPNGSTYTEKINRIDIGLAIGAGVLCKLGSGNLMAEFRYDYGFSNFDKYSGKPPSDAEKNKNRVFTISVGYLFKISKHKL